MTPKDLLLNAVDPAFNLLSTMRIVSDVRARVLVMAIAGQETAWAHRRQMNNGPARSFWQFEKGGGLLGLFRLEPTRVSNVCAALCIPYDITDVFEAMAWHDVLAASLARLLLWTDAAPLPNVGQVDAGWDYYMKLWRPGMPHRQTWNERYAAAVDLVQRFPS